VHSDFLNALYQAATARRAVVFGGIIDLALTNHRRLRPLQSICLCHASLSGRLLQPFSRANHLSLFDSCFMGHMSHRTCELTPLFSGILTERRLVNGYRFTLEDGADRLSRNVGKYRSTLPNIPEQRRSHLRRAYQLPMQNIAAMPKKKELINLLLLDCLTKSWTPVRIGTCSLNLKLSLRRINMLMGGQ
jgi:hypothetical protein